MAPLKSPYIEIQNILSGMSSPSLDFRDLGGMLGQLYLLLVSYPELDKIFELISEADLEDAKLFWIDLISDHRAQWSNTNVDAAYHLELFGLVRALDELAAAHPRSFADDPENWRDTENGFYLVPRSRPRLKLAPRGQGMRRRLLRHHRVIPTVIGARSVEIHALSHRGQERKSPPKKLGAAMFEDLKLHPPIKVGEPFLIKTITGKHMKVAIEAQIQGAIAEPCVALSWPELTVDLEHRAHIRDTLQTVAASTLQAMPQIVVAGSCHEQVEGAWYNRTAIFDGFGQFEFNYAKFSVYVSQEGGAYEGIVQGDTIPVFVTDDYVVGIAICKDLTDFNQTVPLASLELDLLVVPSMGGSSTMDSHEAAALKLKAMNDTRVFVVQQDNGGDGSESFPEQSERELNDAKLLGWVLQTPRKPVGARKTQHLPWVSYDSDIR